jgi:hypothetical protein
MDLRPGYNLVTDAPAETDDKLAALTFFRRCAADDDLAGAVTVAGLEDLLYHAAENERDAVIRELRDTLRRTDSVGSLDVVQFVIDGRLVDEDHFRIRIERSGEATYINVGELFVERPQVVAASHAVARK